MNRILAVFQAFLIPAIFATAQHVEGNSRAFTTVSWTDEWGALRQVGAPSNMRGEPRRDLGALAPLSKPERIRLEALESKRVEGALAQLLANRTKLGLDRDHAFILNRSSVDAFGQTHAHFRQIYRGLRVWGGDFIAHLDKEGIFLSPTDALVRGIALNVDPALSSGEALAVIHRHLQPKGPYARPPQAELVIFPEMRKVHIPILGSADTPGDPNALSVQMVPVAYALAYYVKAELANGTDGIRFEDFIIHAQTGEILASWPSLQSEDSVGTGNSQYSGTVSIRTNSINGGFELRDLTRGAGGNTTLNLNHSGDMVSDPNGTSQPYVDSDNVWGDGQNYVRDGATTSDNGQTAAVDAHFGVQSTWELFRRVFGREGIDGQGRPTQSRVHFSTGYENAFWWDACFCLTFGDGGTSFKTLTPLDVVGHEFAHGVTSTTAGLVYRGESGGLNEATSDIFGTLVEFYVRGQASPSDTIPESGGNWTLGEQMVTEQRPLPLRWMSKPSKDGKSRDAWSQDLGVLDVHYSSGPMNRAFYFLSQGASPDPVSEAFSNFLPQGMAGIGNQKAAAIWFRALTDYLTPISDYRAARTASLRAALDLYGVGSPEFGAVRLAFAAINVGFADGLGDDLEPPTVRAAVQGDHESIELQAITHDNTGVVRVEFHLDGRFLATMTKASAAPDEIYRYAWDSTQVPKGSHTLLVKGWDAAGNMTTSVPVAFELRNTTYQLLINPDFEAGSAGWDGPDGAIRATDLYAVHGNHFARLNGTGVASTHTLSQVVDIPAQALQTWLSFWVLLFSPEHDPANQGTLKVQVKDASGQVLGTLAEYSTLKDSLPPAYWSNWPFTGFWPLNEPLPSLYVRKTLDMSAFRGRRIRLCFEGQESKGLRGYVYSNGLGPLTAQFFLDDLSLRVTETPDTESPKVAASVDVDRQQITLSTFNPVYSGEWRIGFPPEDNVAVTRVEFWMDDTLMATRQDAPYSHEMSAADLPEGTHTLIAKAYDPSGNIGIGTPVDFLVDHGIRQLLLNPHFSFGSNGSWSNLCSNSKAWQLIARIFHDLPLTWDFSLHSNGQSTQSTYQKVMIPSDAESVSLGMNVSAYWNANPDNVFQVQILSWAGELLDTPLRLSGGESHQGPIPPIDLGRYKGQTIRVDLKAIVPGERPTTFEVDDVCLDTCMRPDPKVPRVSASLTGIGPFQLSATATDPAGIQSMEFYLDGRLLRVFNDQPYTWELGTSGLYQGRHAFVAKATNWAGKAGYSAAIPLQLGPPSIAVSILPGRVEIPASSWIHFNAQVWGSVDTSTRLSIAEGQAGGSLTQWGDYKAPATPGTYHIMATSLADPSKTATAVVVVFAASVAISPESATVLSGTTTQFTAAVSGASDPSVTWRVQEAGGGSVSSSGLYTAPTASGIFHVVATSVAYPVVSAAALVSVKSLDLNQDGVLDVLDMAILARAYGSRRGDAAFEPSTDLNEDGRVDDEDIIKLMERF